MNIKAITIAAIILLSLLPAYMLYKFGQRKIRPRESGGRLFLYLFGGIVFVFVYTFLIVFIIKKLFPGA